MTGLEGPVLGGGGLSGIGSAAASGGSAIGGGLGSVSTFLPGVNQYFARRYQQQHQKESYQATRRETYHSLVRNYGSILQRQQEEREALAFGAEDAQRQAQQAIGLVAALAGSGGVSGNSLVAQMQDIARRRLEQDQVALRQQQFRERQARLEALGLHSQAYQQLLSAAGAPIAPFNPLSALTEATKTAGSATSLVGGI